MNCFSIRSARGRRGLTMIEVLLAITIIAVLASLVAAALLHARESARRATCQSRLHQIGIATASFVERNGHFPPHWTEPHGGLAWIGHLLGDMGHPEMQQEIYAKDDVGPTLQLYWRENSVPYFQCPSDPGAVLRWNASFAICIGSELQSYDDYPGWPHTHGMRGWPIRAGDLPDGMSNTAYVAERLSVLPSPTDRRSHWKTPVAYVEPQELDQFADLCATMPTGAVGLKRHFEGSDIRGGLIYDHVMTPNQPSCLNGDWDLGYATYAASSQHTGGVNVLFADGAVHFVSDHVARRVWRAQGTRDGGETISTE